MWDRGMAGRMERMEVLANGRADCFMKGIPNCNEIRMRKAIG